MSISRSFSSSDVCAAVRERLTNVKLIGPQDVTYRPVIEALEKVVIVTKEDFDAMAQSAKAAFDDEIPNAISNFVRKYEQQSNERTG